MDAIKEYLRAVDRLEHGEINLGEYEKLCEPLRDVVEVKHGEWIPYESETGVYGHVRCYCSLCGHVSQYQENFCMACGADMRGKEDECID